MAASAWLKAVLCGVVAAGGGGAAYKAGQRDGARIEAARAQAKAKGKARPRRPTTAAAAPSCPVCTCPAPPAAADPADLVRFLPWVLPPQPELAAPGGLLLAPEARGAGRANGEAVTSLTLGGGWGDGWGSGPSGGSGAGSGGSPGTPPLGPAPPSLLAPSPGPSQVHQPHPIPAPPAAALVGLGATLLLGASRWRGPPRGASSAAC